MLFQRYSVRPSKAIRLSLVQAVSEKDSTYNYSWVMGDKDRVH